MRIDEGFQIPLFEEGHPLLSDPVLPALLRRTFPEDVLNEIEPDLVRFGNAVQNDIRALGERVASPTLTQYDQWGKRVDDLRSSEGFRLIKARAQEEGLPGIFYERKYGQYSRPYGFTKVLLMTGDCHMVFCPLSMTDGAARVIELAGSTAMKEHIYPRLISRDPSRTYVSGQWMTERPGGSDVSMTETTATSDGKAHLLGEQYTLNALARTGSVAAGSRGLSLFLIPLRTPLLRDSTAPVPSANSNKIFVHRLKNKFGTHPVPTAELSLEGSEAYLIGQLNQGVKSITPVLNITRVWSAISSVGYIRRCLAIAGSYANVRAIQGGQRLLRDTPLHVAQLAAINLTYRALAHLVFGTIRLLGKSECGRATREEEGMLRALTPVAKAFAAEKASGAIEEAMASLGGQGYMEETQIGRLLRDSLVEKIWEGTVTVLSLDLLRAFKESWVLQAFVAWANTVISSCSQTLAKTIEAPLRVLNTALGTLEAAYRPPVPSLLPRPALMLMGYVASALFLLEQAVWSHGTGSTDSLLDIEVLRRWVMEAGLVTAIEDVTRAQEASKQREATDVALVFGSIGEVRVKL
ncbi:acyl-CoA dehydrogenase/oxidase C-terminal [Hymenopellis radicata]|nr:acyl-CoA dehydrogenase/oxidase C-terminal [Hymenopellis radicata]